MSVVAVTGASRPLARPLLERLDADPRVERIVGIDMSEPPMPPAKLVLRPLDVRDPTLASALDGADVVVHLASWAEEAPGEGARFAQTVSGTRNLLAAAGKAGVGKVVHLSSALVYGAHPDNDLPLTEESRLRANPDFYEAYHHLLAEELVAEFAEARPSATVTILRPAAVLGAGVDTPVSRHLEAPRLPLVTGYEPPVQFVDVEDLAAAAHLAVTDTLPGAYNVAAEGWLTSTEVCALVGRKPMRVPETPAFAAAHALWRARVLDSPPGALNYLMHPWVVDTTRLRARGWASTRSNREILRAFAGTHHGFVSVGRARVRTRSLAGALVGALALVAGLILVRRTRRSTR